jgi:hypothetical protein
MELVKIDKKSAGIFSRPPRWPLKKFQKSQVHCPVCWGNLHYLKEGAIVGSNEVDKVSTALKTIYSCRECKVWYLSKRKKKGPGRKALPPSEKRSHAFTARLTDDELAFIDERRGKVRVGEWMRQTALTKGRNVVHQDIPEINHETALLLRRMSNNINQLAHRANREGMSPAIFESAVEYIADVMMELKGIPGIKSEKLAGIDSTGDYGVSHEG